jgi:hypothetical protein
VVTFDRVLQSSIEDGVLAMRINAFAVSIWTSGRAWATTSPPRCLRTTPRQRCNRTASKAGAGRPYSRSPE